MKGQNRPAHLFKMSSMESLEEYTRGQLALRNGQDRDEIWVAYKGIIYDVTESRMWRGGKHYQHFAGQDLTEELEEAPHNDRVFGRFRPIGKIKGFSVPG